MKQFRKVASEVRRVCGCGCSYEARYVKEYIGAAQPVWAVGEYWDACAYTGEAFKLDYNQGEPIKRCL